MKNVLIIAYFYPPKGGAGVQRTAKFAFYLRKLGYNVSVLTVREGTQGLSDESLNKDIAEGTRVYRTDIKEAHLLNNLLAKTSKKVSSSGPSKAVPVQKKFNLKQIVRNTGKKAFLGIYNVLYIPDDKKGWIDYAAAEGKKIIDRDKINVIFTTSAPYSCHIIGLKLARETGVKWVADFRDGWAENPFAHYNFLLQAIFNSMEKKVVERADRVISVSKPIIDSFLRRYPGQDKNKFSVITNGYDEEDFRDYNINRITDKFIITYNGSLYGKRSPENFFKAVESLIDAGKINKNEILLRFVGENGMDALASINAFNAKFNNIIELVNYLPHRESLKQIENSAALLLIIEGGPGSEGIYTGKIFEYIRSGRNIIGIVPEGAAKELIASTNTGFCCSPEAVNEIEDAVYKCYLIWKNEYKGLEVDWKIIENYERKKLTEQLAELVEKM